MKPFLKKLIDKMSKKAKQGKRVASSMKLGGDYPANMAKRIDTEVSAALGRMKCGGFGRNRRTNCLPPFYLLYTIKDVGRVTDIQHKVHFVILPNKRLYDCQYTRNEHYPSTKCLYTR